MVLVSQDPELFSGSVRYNIEYGLQDCPIEKVKDVAKKVKVDDFISELDNGFDTGREVGILNLQCDSYRVVVPCMAFILQSSKEDKRKHEKQSVEKFVI